MKKIIFALVCVVSLASCGGNETTTSAETPKQDSIVPQVCTYSYDSSATEIGFGAFKFTEKKEVKGSFLKFTVDSTKEGEVPFQVFDGAVIKIDIEGLSTKDPSRDSNVKTGFFKVMDSTTFITGKIKGFGVVTTYYHAYKKGYVDAIVELKMNNVVKEYYMKLDINGDDVMLTGTINLDDFNAQKALTSLNKACKDLHKGSDGISKTWNEVNIYVSTKLKNSCK